MCVLLFVHLCVSVCVWRGVCGCASYVFVSACVCACVCVLEYARACVRAVMARPSNLLDEEEVLHAETTLPKGADHANDIYGTIFANNVLQYRLLGSTINPGSARSC